MNLSNTSGYIRTGKGANVQDIRNVQPDDIVHNEYIVSGYLRIVMNKHWKQKSSKLNFSASELAEISKNEISRILEEGHRLSRALSIVLRWVGDISHLIKEINTLDEECSLVNSVEGASGGILYILHVVMEEVEKILSQLPLKDLQMMTIQEQWTLRETLADINAELQRFNDSLNEDSKDTSHMAHKLHGILAMDFKHRKEKCDALMENINSLLVTSSACLSSKNCQVHVEMQGEDA